MNPLGCDQHHGPPPRPQPARHPPKPRDTQHARITAIFFSRYAVRTMTRKTLCTPGAHKVFRIMGAYTGAP